MATLPKASAEFAIDCYHLLAEQHPCGNILFSPANLASALSQLALASGVKQEAQIKKVLHWDKVEEAERQRNQRCLTGAKTYGQAANNPTLQPEPTYPKQIPCSEPMYPKPRPRPDPVYPEPTYPKSRLCPEPSKSPCSERDVECETPEGVLTAFSKIVAALNVPSTNYTLIFADKVYVDVAITTLQKLVYCFLKLYRADVEGAEIRNAPELVRRTINLWVELKTQGKIMDLFPKNSFDSCGQVLLTNAVYFKGQWQRKFDKELTVEAPFYQHCVDERYCQNVLLMNRKGIYNTATVEIGCVVVQILEIPYKKNEMSLVVLLPSDCSRGALQQLEEALTYEFLLDCSSFLKPAEVNVFIPKFSLEGRFYPLGHLGLQNLQDPEKANFSRATNSENVAITQLIHATSIEIGEEGGEEAEAPCCPGDKCPPPEAVSFVANRPFLYYIQHHCTQSIIVLGRFSSVE